MTDIDEILNEREKTHGKFSLVSEIHAAFLRIIEEYRDRLPDSQYISLVCTTGKMARVLAGDSKFIDHWRDMSGYPMLVVRALEEES